VVDGTNNGELTVNLFTIMYAPEGAEGGGVVAEPAPVAPVSDPAPAPATEPAPVAEATGGDLLGDANPIEPAPIADETPENWLDGIPESYRENPNFTKYNSVEDLLKGHENLVGMVGKKGLVAPGPDASDEAKAEFYKRIGRPDASADYEWEPPKAQEGDSDGHLDFDLDPDGFAQTKEAAHALGLTGDQFKGVMDMYANDMKERMGAEQGNEVVKANESILELQKDWGEKYDARLQDAQAVIRKFGLADEIRGLGRRWGF